VKASNDDMTESKLEELMMLKSLEMELEDDMKVPSLCYEKSFLRKIPSIIMEAHESIVSLKNEESSMKPDTNLLLMHC
jgi:hypothetical protein